MTRSVAFAVLLYVCAGASPAYAWGCEGHQAVAIVAERLLGREVLAAVTALLSSSPIDSRLSRYCGVERDLMADAATWADDQRAVDPATSGWHFINVPRAVGSIPSDYRRFCAGNCVLEAIVTQYQQLTTSSDPKVRADALRYIIHFVGDLHEPLHTITNGDRGGNCLPVALPDEPIREQENHNFTPNLHRVWDTDVLQRLMKTRRIADSRGLASYVARSAPTGPVSAQAPTAIVVLGWARGSNETARTIAYGKLPTNVPVEPPNVITLSSCDDNNHVGRRMMNLRERVTPAYAAAAEPVMIEQMRLAGERLAAILKSAFPVR